MRRHARLAGGPPARAPDTGGERQPAAGRAGELRLALDTSGPALRHGLAGRVWLAKPNLAELEELEGSPLPDLESRLRACRALVERGAAEFVAVSMGEDGAILVSAGEAWRAAAPRITPISTVGAGDSFTAGLVGALAAGETMPAALAQAVAAGSAALLAPGTQLCRAADVASLLERIRPERLPEEASTATRAQPAAA